MNEEELIKSESMVKFRNSEFNKKSTIAKSEIVELEQ